MRLRLSTWEMYATPVYQGVNFEPRPGQDIRTLKSFPLRSNVFSAPNLGKLSSARTLSNSAALGPAFLAAAVAALTTSLGL